jgi:hypothetical protein
MEALRKEIRQENEVMQNTKVHKNLNIYNHNLSKIVQPKSENISASNLYSTTNSSSSENNIAPSQLLLQSLLSSVDIDQISLIKSSQINSDQNQKAIDQPMLSPKIIPNQSKNNWQYFVGITSGAALVTDKQIDKERYQQNTNFAPFLSYSAELGILKKVKGRFSLGALANYDNIVYIE